MYLYRTGRIAFCRILVRIVYLKNKIAIAHSLIHSLYTEIKAKYFSNIMPTALYRRQCLQLFLSLKFITQISSVLINFGNPQ